jgi:hypothetical protein
LASEFGLPGSPLSSKSSILIVPHCAVPIAVGAALSFGEAVRRS